MDIGSNSVNLFRVVTDDAGVPNGPRETHVVGLKRDAAPDGTLAPDSLARLDARLTDMAQTVAEDGMSTACVVGTSAVRDAPNRAHVARSVERLLGTRLVVLDGTQEATLAFRGARLAQETGDVAVLDVGGASTEIAVGDGMSPTVAISLNVGSVRCNTGSIANDPPAPGAADQLCADIRDRFSERTSTLPRYDTLLGVAGTLTSLAGVDIGRYTPDEVHGYVLHREGVRETMRTLATMEIRRRREVPGLHPDRAPVIVVGAAIVVGAMDALNAERLMVSERSLMDGVALAVLDGSFDGANFYIPDGIS